VKVDQAIEQYLNSLKVSMLISRIDKEGESSVESILMSVTRSSSDDEVSLEKAS
jgi:hypothetical protein